MCIEVFKITTVIKTSKAFLIPANMTLIKQ